MLKKILMGLASVLIFEISAFQTTHANVLISPYYRYFIPQKHDHEQDRVLATLTDHNERISLFVRDHSRQFGVKTAALNNGPAKETVNTVIQTIERRPITARSSITDDGLIFQYWETHAATARTRVLFGYTTDRRVKHVKLLLQPDVRQLKLYDGRYFFCVLNPATDEVIEAQGIGGDGKVLRQWNGRWDYQPRRTWVSFFWQTYPYVVS